MSVTQYATCYNNWCYPVPQLLIFSYSSCAVSILADYNRCSVDTLVSKLLDMGIGEMLERQRHKNRIQKLQLKVTSFSCTALPSADVKLKYLRTGEFSSSRTSIFTSFIHFIKNANFYSILHRKQYKVIFLMKSF